MMNALVTVPKTKEGSTATEASKHRLLAVTMHNLLHTIFHLLYSYADVSSASAILSAVDSQIVSRLDASWNELSPKTRNLYKHLSSIVPTVDSDVPVSTHVDLVCRILSSPVRDTRAGLVACCPYLLPLVREICNVNRIYVSGYTVSSETGEKHPVLTEVGTRIQEDLLRLVKSCQGGLGSQPPAISTQSLIGDFYPSQAVLKTLFDKLPLPTTKPISSPFKGGGALENFLLTRIYHPLAVLWSKSLRIQPLAPREIVPDFMELEARSCGGVQSLLPDDSENGGNDTQYVGDEGPRDKQGQAGEETLGFDESLLGDTDDGDLSYLDDVLGENTESRVLEDSLDQVENREEDAIRVLEDSSKVLAAATAALGDDPQDGDSPQPDEKELTENEVEDLIAKAEAELQEPEDGSLQPNDNDVDELISKSMKEQETATKGFDELAARLAKLNSKTD